MNYSEPSCSHRPLRLLLLMGAVHPQRHSPRIGVATGECHRLHLCLWRRSQTHPPHRPESTEAHHRPSAGTGLQRPAGRVRNLGQTHRAAQARDAPQARTPPLHRERLRHRRCFGRNTDRRQHSGQPLRRGDGLECLRLLYPDLARTWVTPHGPTASA